ncbi:hypothetical protein J437_LFUL001487 [Ladona fulva]|uniref:Serine aminopeptidase S33 domain-containing protein n=1 Tax=Ladona fulva TaxID=123851 RepID=A0A8K0JXL0_LADFU|nr:hypothetical protein J437_LFUL001487 [Ladona fulva]
MLARGRLYFAAMNGLKRSVLGVHSILKLSLTAQTFTKRKPHVLDKELLCGCFPRTMSSVSTQFLDLGCGRKIAYKYREGDTKTPTVVYSPGIMQTMEDVKAVAVDNFCKENGVNCIRYDYEGLGESSGSLDTAIFGQWIEDLQNIVDKICKTPVLYVSFSMGGWISTVVAQRTPNKLHSLLYVSPGFNFLYLYYLIFYEKLTAEQKQALDDGKRIKFNDIFLRWDFAWESKRHHIDFEKPVPLNAPIRIIHGMKDRNAPYSVTLEVASLFESMDIDVYLRKSGGHNMDEPQDMALMLASLKNLVQDYPIEK